jgi:chromosome segregation ATPase
MTTPSRAQAMLAARAKANQDKRQRALAAVQALETAGTPVTATAVATAAGLSTWLAYADGIREHIEATPHRQTDHEPGPSTAAPPRRGEPVTQTSLRTNLTTARDETRQLRTEQDKLHAQLRLQLGTEIQEPDRAELTTRIATLETSCRKLATEHDAHATETNHTQQRIHELEDDLTTARKSLRRVTRQANQ